MTHEITTDESYGWFRATLEHLVSIPRLSDDDFEYIVYEVLDLDVRAYLHETGLDRLVAAHFISETTKNELLDIRTKFIALVDLALPLSDVRRSDDWLALARRCERILASSGSPARPKT